MSGITDLEELIHAMRPEARDGEFVVVTTETPGLPAEAMVREAEGTTLVLRREDADAAGLAYDFVTSWITLTVHSSLDAVGLTAAFSTALADAGIPCNVLAGYRHDHLLVPSDRRDDALEVLAALTEQ